ncbi:MAG: pentapeptide repeat-containing protein, partial [Symploca sp. SIO3E6]|nr:pentapeptide repeat-containing protein [Caldora sp. SIO3E6]
GASLGWTTLRGANLTRANFYRAKLCWSNLTGAILVEAVLIDANLNQITWRNTDLRRAIMPDGFQHE